MKGSVSLLSLTFVGYQRSFKGSDFVQQHFMLANLKLLMLTNPIFESHLGWFQQGF